MPTPPERCTLAADLRARADRRPRVDHRAGADVGADVHVARHEDDASVEERAPPSRRRRGRPARRPPRSRASAGSCRRTRTGRARSSPSRELEQQEDRLLQPLVHDDVLAGELGHPRLAAIEQVDRLGDGRATSVVAGVELVAVAPTALRSGPAGQPWRCRLREEALSSRPTTRLARRRRPKVGSDGERRERSPS